jgi:hypothetical protein
MNSSAAVLVGSAVSAIVAMAVVALQYSLERRRQSLAERADRLGDFLASSYAVVSGIEAIAKAPLDDKAQVEAGIRSVLEDRLNTSLTRLRLFEEADVVAAATYLERELTRITGLARVQVWSRADWRDQRAELSKLTNDYERTARRSLGRPRLGEELGFYVPERNGFETSRSSGSGLE